MKTIPMNETLYDYVIQHAPLASPVLADIEAYTNALPNSAMMISQDQGAFLNLLVKLLGSKLVLEVGCFTGYGSVAMASGLPADGRLITLDHNPESSAKATEFFQAAGVAEKIEVKIGDALASMKALVDSPQAGQFDMVFIDADKERMPQYLDHAHQLLRQGGLVVADNVLWGGSVVEPTDDRESTVAVRAFNDKARADERFDRVLLHISDGLYLLRKR